MHLESLLAAFPKLTLAACLMILPAGDAAPGKQSFEVHFDDFSTQPLNTPPKEN